MEQELFVSKLKSLAPTKENLEKLQFPEDFMDWIQQRYYCIKRAEEKLTLYSNDVLLMLLKCYDCSKVEIGMISFDIHILEKQDYYKIGNVEQNILVLNKTLLCVEVLDFENIERVIWKCASNSSNFLEALLICAEFFSTVIQDVDLRDNKEYKLQQVNLCMEKAGGEEYLNFYEMLLGYSD